MKEIKRAIRYQNEQTYRDNDSSRRPFDNPFATYHKTIEDANKENAEEWSRIQRFGDPELYTITVWAVWGYEDEDGDFEPDCMGDDQPVDGGFVDGELPDTYIIAIDGKETRFTGSVYGAQLAADARVKEWVAADIEIKDQSGHLVTFREFATNEDWEANGYSWEDGCFETKLGTYLNWTDPCRLED